MKKSLLSATALALCIAGPAFAAPHDHDGDRHGDHGTPATTPATPAAAPAHPALIPGTPIIAPGADRHGHGNAMTPAATPAADAHHDRDHRGGATNGTNPFNGRGGNADRTHAGRGHNSAFDALRRAFNAPRHFHHGTYHRPHGWYAHRWTYGDILPSLFFGRSYWIDDYSDFALSNPPPGTVWVRYGDDALLIDEDSGEVIQVVYGVFY